MSVSPSPDSASASPVTNSIACRPRPHISRLRQCSASGPHAHGSLCRTQTGLMFFPPRVLFFRFFFPLQFRRICVLSAVTLCLHGSLRFLLPTFHFLRCSCWSHTHTPCSANFHWFCARKKTGSKTLHVLCKTGSSIN